MPGSGVMAEADRTKALMKRFELPLLQFAARITGDRERARDIVQETFVQFERKGPVTQNGEPATWLFTVCRNRALNVVRKERRMTFLDDEVMEHEPDEELLPNEMLEQKEARGFLLKIVATLPPRQQEVLQLKFQNGLSYQEIAEITKTSANNVGVLLHTALKTLRERYRHSAKEFLSFNPGTT